MLGDRVMFAKHVEEVRPVRGGLRGRKGRGNAAETRAKVLQEEESGRCGRRAVEVQRLREQSSARSECGGRGLEGRSSFEKTEREEGSSSVGSRD